MESERTNTDPIRPGGLMRCCTELTIGRRADAGAEGDVEQCPHCRDWVRFRDGAWEWCAEHGADLPPLFKPSTTSSPYTVANRQADR